MRILVDARLDLVTEMRDQALDRPRRSVAERADGVALDLLRHFEQHVDFALVGAAFGHAAQDAPHPARAFAAGRALAAALVLVEIGNAGNRPDQIGRLVHHDHGGGAEAGAKLAEAVEVHRRVDDLLGRHHAHRRAAGDHGLQVVPAAANAAAMPLDQFAERNPHRLFDVAGPLDMAGDTEQFGADIVGPADRGKPRSTAPQDVGRDRDGLDVVDRGRAAIEADIGREWRFQPRLALLAFEAFQQRGLFATDIGAGAVRDIDVERPAVDIVLADQLRIIGLIDRGLQMLPLADELAAHIDVAGMRVHREACQETAFDEKMWVVPHDLAVLAGAGLGLVGVDHEIARPPVGRFLGHERPFQPGRESRPATAAQAGGLHLVDDPVATLVDDRLGAVPRATAAGAFKPPIVEAVEVLEDAILVVEHDLKFPGSTIGLRVSEARGASAEGQRPQQAGFERCAQRVALQQKNERGRRDGVHADIAPVLHRADPSLPDHGQCAVTRHVVSFSVVGPPTGAEN